MLIYGIVLVCTIYIYVILRYGFKYDKARVDRITISFFFISYFLLLCLRDISVGVDIKSYSIRFQRIQDMNWREILSYISADNESAFLLLNKIVSLVGDFRLLLIVSAIMIVLPIMILYRDEAEDSILTISFFLISLLFSMFFSGMRQSIAIAMAVPAYYYSKKRRMIPFIIMVIIAFLFHKTGIVIVAIYPIYHAKITTKWLWVVVPIMGGIYFFRKYVFEFLLSFAGEEYVREYSYLSGSSGQKALMALFLLLAIYSYIILDEKKAKEEDIGLRNILLLAACIQLFSPINPVVVRINMYFILFIPVAMTRINTRCKEQYEVITQLATFVMSTYFVYHFFQSPDSILKIDQYKFFF